LLQLTSVAGDKAKSFAPRMKWAVSLTASRRRLPPHKKLRKASMKAAYIDRFGGPEVLQSGDLPDPVAGTGKVVVDVAAASVNGADWRVRTGQYGQAAFPLVLGRDFSVRSRPWAKGSTI
jgi:hypothetical protein